MRGRRLGLLMQNGCRIVCPARLALGSGPNGKYAKANGPMRVPFFLAGRVLGPCHQSWGGDAMKSDSHGLREEA